MKFMVGMEPQEVVEIYEDNALLFVGDVYDSVIEFDCIQADIWLLENLWDWINTENIDSIIEATPEEQSALFNLMVSIRNDINKILALNDV